MDDKITIYEIEKRYCGFQNISRKLYRDIPETIKFTILSETNSLFGKFVSNISSEIAHVFSISVNKTEGAVELDFIYNNDDVFGIGKIYCSQGYTTEILEGDFDTDTLKLLFELS